jgi:hypothetical protein
MLAGICVIVICIMIAYGIYVGASAVLRHRHTAAAVFEEMDNTIGRHRNQRQQLSPTPQRNMQVFKTAGFPSRRRSLSALPSSSRFPPVGQPPPLRYNPVRGTSDDSDNPNNANWGMRSQADLAGQRQRRGVSLGPVEQRAGSLVARRGSLPPQDIRRRSNSRSPSPFNHQIHDENEESDESTLSGIDEGMDGDEDEEYVPSRNNSPASVASPIANRLRNRRN